MHALQPATDAGQVVEPPYLTLPVHQAVVSMTLGAKHLWLEFSRLPAQDTVNFPVHTKNFNLNQLRQLCREVRADIIHTVSKTGGDLLLAAGPKMMSHFFP